MSTPETTDKPMGAFSASLKRNHSKIRSDRAEAINEQAELHYRRQVEDLEVALKTMHRDQENMLDMSPDNTMTLKIASDFDAKSYAEKDLELSMKIHMAEIKLAAGQARLKHLFGGTE